MTTNPLINLIGDQKRFLPCKIEQVPGDPKLKKVPQRQNGKGPTGEGWSDPQYWMTATEAGNAMVKWKLHAMSVMWGGADHDTTGIDFDKCVDKGEINDTRKALLIAELNTYTTLSISGTGLHLYLVDKTHLIPEKFNEADGIGIYRRSKHFAETFKPFGQVKQVRVITDQAEARAICDLLGVAPTDTKPQPTRTQPGHAGSHYAQKALEGELADLRSAPEGDRNNALNRAAFSLGQLIGAGVLDRATVEVELTTAARSIGLKELELQKTIKSGLSKGIAQPRQIPQRPPLPDAIASQNTDTSHLQQAPSQTTAAPDAKHISTPDEPDTDTANAARFASQHMDVARFVEKWGWMVYDGKRWRRDELGTVMKLAKQTARSIAAEAADPAISDKKVDILLRWAKASKSLARLTSMVTLAQPELPAYPDDFDKDPYLFNFANGTLDLRTGVLRPHVPADMITKLTDVPYDPNAKCPTWLKFQERITAGDTEMIKFKQRGYGYSMTGDTDEHCFLFLYGTGRNGKSTETETIQAAMGDYAGRVRSETLLMKRDNTIPNDVASMVGVRMIIASELPEGRRIDESLMKDLTGGDTIRARFMHQEFFDFKPQAKIWMFGNHKPNVKGTDEGIWSRVRMIPFEVTIPLEERDPKLKAKLVANELPGILAWMVEGCRQWMQGGLRPPSKVENATAAYRAEMDILAQFIAECCISGDGKQCASSALYTAYKDFTGNEAVNKVEFGKRLKERGFKPDKGTKGVRIWLGIGLIDEPQKPLLSEDEL